MKLHYYPETDSLYIELGPGPGVETREVSDGLNVDLDAGGGVVGFDIDHASRRLDLSTLEAEALPLRSIRAGLAMAQAPESPDGERIGPIGTETAG